MSGIAGIISTNDNIDNMLNIANRIQHHRGPDNNGIYSSRIGCWNIGFAHQRLSIVDLSSNGKQPMFSADGSSIIVYNGEVYNYKELRDELIRLGYCFISGSDTEVVLTALIHWGPDIALRRFNGMWAFAWLDLNQKKLVLSRDRMGSNLYTLYKSDDRLYFCI